jgi:hypothetical protein
MRGDACILTDAAFELVLREQGKGKISYGAATAYDQLFRTRERNKIERLLEYIYYLDVYISIGASHFYAEVLRVKKVAAELQVGKSLFIVFDKLFRGTIAVSEVARNFL